VLLLISLYLLQYFPHRSESTVALQPYQRGQQHLPCDGPARSLACGWHPGAAKGVYAVENDVADLSIGFVRFSCHTT
jgi:hypothetical protein